MRRTPWEPAVQAVTALLRIEICAVRRLNRGGDSEIYAAELRAYGTNAP